jgi:hypothetical protein
VRHPLDVLTSNLDYVFLANYERLGALTDAQRRYVADRYVEDYLERGGDARWTGFGMGTWSENVASWTARTDGVPGLTVRYEDLLDDAATEVARIGRFLGLDVTGADVERAVEASSFDRMRALEEAEIRRRRPGFFYKENFRAAHARGHRFMNRGRSGAGQQALSEAQLERARVIFGPQMERFGYATEPVPEPSRR